MVFTLGIWEIKGRGIPLHFLPFCIHLWNVFFRFHRYHTMFFQQFLFVYGTWCCFVFLFLVAHLYDWWFERFIRFYSNFALLFGQFSLVKFPTVKLNNGEPPLWTNAVAFCLIARSLWVVTLPLYGIVCILFIYQNTCLSIDFFVSWKMIDIL